MPKTDRDMTGRIDPELVRMKLEDQLTVIAAHLDLEGIAYIKVTRTAAQDCFAADKTCEILKLEGMDLKAQKEAFWDKPAYVKWAKKEEIAP